MMNDMPGRRIHEATGVSDSYLPLVRSFSNYVRRGMAERKMDAPASISDVYVALG